MRTQDIVRRAAMNLRQAKGRTILTSLAIAVGATTITLALAAGNGGRAYTNEMVQTSGDTYSLSVYPKPDQSTSSDELPEYGVEEETRQDGNIMTNQDIEKLRSLGGVESITPMLSFDTNYVTRGGAHKKLVAPVSVKVDRTEMKLAAGSLTDNMVSSGNIIISEKFLPSFGFDNPNAAIGQTLLVNVPQFSADGAATGQSKDYTFTIEAVDKESDTTLFYESTLRISAADSKIIYEYQRGKETSGRYYGLVVLAKRGTDIASLQKAVTDKGYEAYSVEDTREALLQMVNVAQWGLTGFGILAILASVFGIINTQYISVLERTQQIGLMKALGARRRDVSRLFRYEAAWVGFLGGIIGVGIAFLVTLFNPLIASALSLDSATQLLKMDWMSCAILVLSLMLVAIISGYFPARKAAKLDPIEALRTE